MVFTLSVLYSVNSQWPNCKDTVPKIRNKYSQMKLCGLVPNSYIHVSVSDLYIPVIGPPTLLQQNRWTNRGYTEVAQTYMNVVIGNEAAQFHLWEIGSCLQCIWCTNQRKLVNKRSHATCLISSLFFSTLHLSQEAFQNIVKPRSRKVKNFKEKSKCFSFDAAVNLHMIS
jgi:hypothetical protein